MADQYALAHLDDVDSRDATTELASTVDGVACVKFVCGGAGSTTAGLTAAINPRWIIMNTTPTTTNLPSLKGPVIVLDHVTGSIFGSLSATIGGTITSYLEAT